MAAPPKEVMCPVISGALGKMQSWENVEHPMEVEALICRGQVHNTMIEFMYLREETMGFWSETSSPTFWSLPALEIV